ncbi:MAG TPA: chemotaxis protein [Syntrophorhabdaceae bacterium]|nr:chemotaxis protein [Syntrophorhabdaceae bacterium]
MAQGTSNILLETGTNEVEILELFIDEEGYRGYYGVNVAKVIEIIPVPEKKINPPDSRKGIVSGLFNHRNKVVVLIDLALWLDKKRVEMKPCNVLITEFNNVVTAFLVSGVTRIHRVTWQDIKPLDGYMENVSDAVTGVIELENKLVFLLDLEKAIAELNPEFALKAPSEEEGGAGSIKLDLDKPIKVLHADDSNVIRHNVKLRLEEHNNFIVHSVTNGEEAWRYLAEIEEQARQNGSDITEFVDVVLTDIEMPGMDGYHLCKKIKEDQGLSNVPVILFSSLINEKLIHKGQSVGADGQFAKPDLGLMTFMRDLVQKRQKAA